MTSQTIIKPTSTGITSCDPATRVTRSLLGYGVIAGPLYVAVSLAQGLTRQGFDFSRSLIGLMCIGAAQQSVDETCAYVAEREAFVMVVDGDGERLLGLVDLLRDDFDDHMAAKKQPKTVGEGEGVVGGIAQSGHR